MSVVMLTILACLAVTAVFIHGWLNTRGLGFPKRLQPAGAGAAGGFNTVFARNGSQPFENGKPAPGTGKPARLMKEPPEAQLNTSNQPLRIWLVDDDETFGRLQPPLLKSEPGVDSVRYFASAGAVLLALPIERAPDVILLDVAMSGISEIEAIGPIRTLVPGIRVVMLTTFFNPVCCSQALAAGASGFLLKRYSAAEIVTALRSITPEQGIRA